MFHSVDFVFKLYFFSKEKAVWKSVYFDGGKQYSKFISEKLKKKFEKLFL